MRGPGAFAMEYLVTMTTHVPDGTPGQAIDDIRTREAAHSRELAAQGHLLRLWRPPLQPGEWRTLGLFAADDESQLEEVLASMPLRVWRTDEVTPLSPHPNDPALAATKGADGSTEFLITFAISVPEGTPRPAVENTEAREAQRVKELAGQGQVLRVAIITGGSEGIGAGLVAGYRRQGWAVVATARTIKFSARLLDLSPQTLAKGIRAGVIPEITAGNLSALAAIPVLTRARTDDGFDIPVLRVGVQAPSPWDAYTPARPTRDTAPR